MHDEVVGESDYSAVAYVQRQVSSLTAVALYQLQTTSIHTESVVVSAGKLKAVLIALYMGSDNTN